MAASEFEKMVAGRLYRAADPDLVARRAACRRLLREHAQIEHGDASAMRRLLARLLGRVGEGAWIEPPFYCDYGTQIAVGDRFYANFDCVFLDVAPITIGDDVMLGPAVQIYTAAHPLDATERASGLEYGRPVEIGNHVWLGGGAIVLPGVRIGDRAVIGAGSVVTKDVPAGVFAAGNPCRPIREL